MQYYLQYVSLLLCLRWHDAAELLSESDLDPAKVSDPVVRMALQLVPRIAQRDLDAAKELVAQ